MRIDLALGRAECAALRALLAGGHPKRQRCSGRSGGVALMATAMARGPSRTSMVVWSFFVERQRYIDV